MKTKLQFIALSLFLIGLLSTSSFAQLTGGSVYTIDNTVSGAANLFPNTNTFNSFTTAVAALNATAAGSIKKTVTIDVIAGEEFSEPPVSVTYLNPSSNNASIVFERRGGGPNPVLSGSNGTGTSDYTFSINGGDNYAIDGIDFTDNISNNTPTKQMEAGIALIGLASDGCNNNTISNCSITLNQTNANNNFGIYVLSNGDPNNNNVFTNDKIQQALNGYYFSGGNDAGNEIRQAGAGRSIITDIGTTTTSNPSGVVYGIYYDGQTNFSITRTLINNITYYGNTNGDGYIYGIAGGQNSGPEVIDHDTLNGLIISAGTNDSIHMEGMSFDGVGASTIISNNLINNMNATAASKGGYIYAIWNSPVLPTSDTFFIHDNIISSLLANTSLNVGVAGMIQNSACYAVYNNLFTTFHAGGPNGGLNSNCTAMYLVNPFSGMAQLHDNTITDFSGEGGTVSGIYLGSNNPPVPPVYNNDISNLSCTTGNVIGMLLTSGNLVVYNNKIHGLSGASTGTGKVVIGLEISGGGFGASTPSYLVYNNMVYNLRADAATNTSFSNSTGGNVVGISLPNATTAGAVTQLYFNTVYLNGAATSSSQTSSALFIRSTAATVANSFDIQNNIFDNSYTGGNAVAFWYNNLNVNFQGIASTSNHNLLFAGTPSPTRLLFYAKGADSIQAIGAYKTLMGAREQNSISVDPDFVSPTGTIDVHIQNASPASTAGASIAGITRDFDYNSRPSPSGTNPDIGADEIGTVCAQTIAGRLTTTDDIVCPGSSGLISIAGISGSPVLWQSGSSSSGNFTTISGASGNTLNTPAINQTTYFRVIVGSGSCTDTSNSPLSLIVNPAPSPSFTYNVNGAIVDLNSGASTGNISYYTWSFGDGNTSTQPNPIHRYAGNGTFHVCLTIYDPNNCSNTYCQDITITNNCNATAGTVTALRDTICSGTVGNLTLAGNSVGDSIHWQSSTDNVNFTTIVGQNGTTLETSSLTQSTYFRVVIGTGGCTATSISVLLFVPLQLVSNFTTSISGNTVAFNSSGSSGNIVHYSWNFGDDSTSAGANPSHTYASLGKDSSYYVCLTLFDGSNCSSTYCLYTEIKSDGIPFLNGNDYLVVYPSPFSDYFTISSKQGSGLIEQVEVYDVLGRLVLTKIPGNGGVSSLQVDGTTLMASGIYYVKVKTTTADYVTKVVKE